jgi:hypothetical protein
VHITRRRAIGVTVGVAALIGFWVPSFVARNYTNAAQPIDFLSHPDKGWRFLYDTVRLTRHASLGSEGPALQRARQVWPRSDGVELVYLEGPVTVPVAQGGFAPPAARRTVRPRSRLTWFVYGHIGSRSRQVVGLLDMRSGRVVWDLRRVIGRRA